MRILWWRMNANAAQARTIKGLILVAVGLGALTLSLPESSEPARRGIALLDVDAKNVARFEDGSGSNRRLLERTAHGWSQSAPWTAEADSSRVEDQLNALAQVQIKRTPNVEDMTFLRRIVLTETDGLSIWFGLDGGCQEPADGTSWSATRHGSALARFHHP